MTRGVYESSFLVRVEAGVEVCVFGGLSHREIYPLLYGRILILVFKTANEEPAIIIRPLASALDCGSEGLKSSAPSSTRFSSSSNGQEKKNKNW